MKKVTLPGILKQTAENLASILPEGACVAVMPFEAENNGLSIFFMEELAVELGAYGIEVADRQNLEFVFKEQNFQLSGNVSDESMQSIGKMLGAEFIVTGRFWDLGYAHRLAVTSTNMETALRSSTPSRDIPNDKTLREMVAALGRQVPTLKPSVVEQARRQQPQTAGDFLDRGITFLDRGEFGIAVMDLTEALNLRPDFMQAYFWRGYAYNEMGNYTQAIADYSQAIRINPNLAEAFNNRGVAHRKMGNYTQAIADFNQAIRIDPNYAGAFNNRGNAHSDMGNYTQAIADFNQAIRIDPNLAEAFNNRGNAHYKMENYTQAIADYTQAIRIDPNDALAFNNRGFAYYKTDNLNKAIADYEAALRIDPNHELARNNLDIARRQRGR